MALLDRTTRVRRLADSVNWRLGNASERLFERRHGVRTAEYLYLEDFGIDEHNRLWHDPSNWLSLRRALARLHVGSSGESGDVFVDYGSGLGRAVLVAASMPFRRVIGVELSPQMAERSRANVATARPRLRARDVEIVTSDAVGWPVPDDLTVAFFYCPFTGEVFDQVVGNLLASVDAAPRPLRLVYSYPVEHARLLATSRMRVLDVVSSTWPPRSRRGGEVIVTYLVLPTDPALRREHVTRFPRRLRGAEQWLGPYEPGYRLQKPQERGGVVIERPAAEG